MDGLHAIIFLEESGSLGKIPNEPRPSVRLGETQIDLRKSGYALVE
jgi:hypothetical protein